jgi:hypothetical protein
MVITKIDQNISDHLGSEYEKVKTYQCVLFQEFQKALFDIFSGLVGMLSLMQSTQVPKSINYYLSTFIFFMKIYFNLQCHNKSIFHSQNSTLRQHQYA